jgi:hypothetical protein
LDEQVFFRRLRKLIGRRCRHWGQRCVLVEVLADERSVVLLCEEGTPPIQGDQFGRALRRACETRQVSVLAPDGEGLSAEMMELLQGLEADAA